MKVYHDRWEVLSTAISAVSERRVTVYELDGQFGKPVKEYGVNWKCCGTQQPENAELMAESLQQAANIAHCLNAANIVLDYTTDPVIEDLRSKEDDETALNYINVLRDTLVQDLESLPCLGDEDWDYCKYDVISTLTAEFTTLIQGQ